VKKHLLIFSIVVAASVLVLAACNRPNLRLGNTNPAAADTTQADNTGLLKNTTDSAQAQATQAPAATEQQSGDSTASGSAISTDLNDLSNMFDSLTNDLNSTDTLSDFK
jgi:hypothetical protein